ncbi:MAG: CPBP family intramembrane metalloprotease [Ktedonobacteraceae bacterium]|nr:CPBP family intramembrane metalloprotease [Ktedonobacteraceae bacterium]
MSAITVAQDQLSVTQVRKARRGLTVYFSILIPLSVVWYVLDDMRILNDHYTLLMFTPAISSILARLILREGVKDVSFQLGGRRGLAAIAFVVLFPILLALFTYIPFWLFGWAQLYPKGLIFSSLSAQPALDVTLNVLLLTVIGTAGVLPFAMGEELGWRGFMLTRMISAKIPWPIFVSGLIWGLWHFPLILGGLYDVTPNLLLGTLIALLSVLGYVYIISWVRLYSGSVWPAALAHAAFNIVYNDTFGAATKGGTYLLGETGLVSGIVIIVIAVLLYRFWPIRQPLLNPQQLLEDATPTRKVAPGYLAIGVLLIVSGAVSLLQHDYFILTTCVFAGLGFLVYSINPGISWKERARWQQVLLILLLTLTVLSFLLDLLQALLSIRFS